MTTVLLSLHRTDIYHCIEEKIDHVLLTGLGIAITTNWTMHGSLIKTKTVMTLCTASKTEETGAKLLRYPKHQEQEIIIRSREQGQDKRFYPKEALADFIVINVQFLADYI